MADEYCSASAPHWTNVFATLHPQMVEISLQSFAPSLAHASLLRQYVASFPY
jgi:hypothetical protein